MHAGGLVNEPGGQRELVVGCDDELVGTESRVVPREDVAEVCVQALLHQPYVRRAFDLRAKPVGEGTPTLDFEALIAQGLENRTCRCRLRLHRGSRLPIDICSIGIWSIGICSVGICSVGICPS